MPAVHMHPSDFQVRQGAVALIKHMFEEVTTSLLQCADDGCKWPQLCNARHAADIDDMVGIARKPSGQDCHVALP